MISPLARAKRQTETQIVRAILDYLAAHRIMAWRQNTGAARNPRGRLVRFGRPGMPDIAGILPGGRALFIEVKRPGSVPTPLQRQMQARLAAAGALAFTASRINDVRGMLGFMHPGGRQWGEPDE